MSRAYETIIAGLNSFDPDEQRLAVEASVNFGSREEIVDKLIWLLRDEDKGVRDAVANAILSIARQFESVKKEIVKNLCEFLCYGDVCLRNLSAEMLRKIGKDALNEIMQLANHDNKDVRKMAVDLIGLIGDKSTVEFLIEKLNDPDPNVVTSSIEALGNIGNDRAIDILIDSFSKFGFAQIPIVESLGKIGESSENKKAISDFLIGVFEEVEDVILKSAIIEALGKVGDESHIDFLITLTFNENIAIQKMAVVSIVEICARRNCNLNSNKYFFKSFFERAKEIFHNAEDEGFRVCFLDFIAKSIKYDEVKSFVLSLLNQKDEILAKVHDIVVSNAIELIKFALKNQIDEERFLNLIEVVFYNAGEIFEDVGLKNAVVEKLSEIFERVDSESKISILNLLRLLDEITFEMVLKKVENEPDPLVRMYVDSNLK